MTRTQVTPHAVDTDGVEGLLGLMAVSTKGVDRIDARYDRLGRPDHRETKYRAGGEERPEATVLGRPAREGAHDVKPSNAGTAFDPYAF